MSAECYEKTLLQRLVSGLWCRKSIAMKFPFQKMLKF